MNTKEMAHNHTPRGVMDYKSAAGILALQWKDTNVATVLSTDVGVEPLSTVKRYDRQEKMKKEVPCPQVIMQCHSNMGVLTRVTC